MPHSEVFEIGALFNARVPLVTPLDQDIMQVLIEALVLVDVIELRADPKLPNLHDAIARGLRYVLPQHQQPPLRDVVSALLAGEIACGAAVAWRCAELRVRFGIHAVPVFRWGLNSRQDGRAIHTAVGLPSGEIEDVSKRAGMR